MKRAMFATALLLAGAVITSPASADLVIDPNGAGFFADLGGTGFGTAPRLLTLQQNVFEAGGTVAGVGGTTLFTRGATGTVVAPTFCTDNNSCGSGSGGGTRTGANESLVYSVAALGWFTGAQVGIGLDTNQTGNSGPLTFDTLRLTLYNAAGVELGHFDGNGPIDISEALLAFQQGNGNSVFNIGLDVAQQAQYDAILAANGGAANVFEGLSASFGCGAFGPSVCGTTNNFSSNDGAESFLAFQQVAVPGPVAGAGIPGLLSAMGLWGFWRHRRRAAVA